MNRQTFFSWSVACFLALGSHANAGSNPNQTDEVCPIRDGDELPFRITIEQADFSLPGGIHSFASAIYKGKWFFLCGRTNGMHNFSNTVPNDNFPPSQQNTFAVVVEPATGESWVKSLDDPSSGLTQLQIDLLSVTSPQSYQTKKKLYITGGYGIDTASTTFGTKDVLTSVDLKDFINWVVEDNPAKNAAQSIKQISDPVFQITGGYMGKTHDHPTLLIFGQNFTGYYTDSSNGDYSEQIRRFHIHDHDDHLSVEVLDPLPTIPDPSYRRRDLNVEPIIQYFTGHAEPAFVAYSGVFTEAGGIWTVPVVITEKGKAAMPDPNADTTFKQGMNNYTSATVLLSSNDRKESYTVLLGGISYGYFDGDTFTTDAEFPFINQVTTVKMDKKGFFYQYLMDAEYPVIPSTGSNPGNPLLFGAGANFMPADGVDTYHNGVIKLDKLKKGQQTLLGYIVGGIQSTVPNTNGPSDSSASAYVFKVYGVRL